MDRGTDTVSAPQGTARHVGVVRVRERTAARTGARNRGPGHGPRAEERGPGAEERGPGAQERGPGAQD